jgi:hypothetical protein
LPEAFVSGNSRERDQLGQGWAGGIHGYFALVHSILDGLST